MLDLKAVGARIQRARKDRHMTQSDLADKIDIALSHMSDIETGKANFGVDILVRIAEALEVPTDWILRPDIPERTIGHIEELSQVMNDCSAKEAETIIRSLIELKQLIISYRPEQ